MIGKCGKPEEECKCGCDKDPRKGTIEKRRKKSKINIEIMHYSLVFPLNPM